MRPKKKQHRTTVIILVLLALLIGMFGMNRLDITGSNTRTARVSGYTVVAEALPSYGASQFLCGGKQPTISDQSKDGELSITGYIPNTAGRDCDSYTVGVRVTITDLDLTTKERVVIHRTARVNSYAKGGNGYSTDLNGLNGGANSRDGPTSRSYGTITITNDPQARVLRVYGDGDDSLGKIIPYNNQTVTLNNTILISTKGIVYGGQLEYTITGIDVTELPKPTTATPTNNHGTSPQATSPGTTSLWQRIINWLTSLLERYTW